MSIASSIRSSHPSFHLNRRHLARWLAAPVLGCGLLLSGGCGSDDGPPGGGGRQGLAVLSSDYAVTTVSLYDPAAAKVTDGCVHTDAAGPILRQPLLGDVALPTAPQHGGELVVIDRTNAVLSFISPADCGPRAQLSVSTGGFKANPHDVISVSADKAYVTRYETNSAPTSDPADLDEGDDLLVINPRLIDATGTATSAGAILGRIALSGYAAPVAGATVAARPDRGVYAGGLVYVTLGSMNADLSVAGAGRVVVIDAATDTVAGTIELPAGLKGCSAISHNAANNRLYVSCGGSFADLDQAAGSGLVQIDLAVAPPTATVVVPASALAGLPINFSYALVIGETAFIGTLGMTDFATKTMLAPDAFYAVGLGAGGTVTKLLDGGAYNFGRATVDPVRQKVYLPDGDAVAPRVHIFDAAVTPPVAAGTFVANPSTQLPPREVAWY